MFSKTNEPLLFFALKNFTSENDKNNQKTYLKTIICLFILAVIKSAMIVLVIHLSIQIVNDYHKQLKRMANGLASLNIPSALNYTSQCYVRDYICIHTRIAL